MSPLPRSVSAKNAPQRKSELARDLRSHQGARGQVQSGFSLVEVMVGLTVGLITVLVVSQTMSLFGGGRNTILGGTSAQENGLFAMQLVATDIRSTGAGSYSQSSGGNSASPYACTNVCSYYGASGGAGSCSWPSGTSPSGAANGIASISGNALTGASYHLQLPLSPVIIERSSDTGSNAGIRYAANNDIVTVRDAVRFVGSVPTQLESDVDLDAGTPLTVTRTFGVSQNDVALLVSGSNCTVFHVTSVNASLRELTHTSSAFNAGTWDSSAGNHFDAGTLVFDLGNATNGPVTAREYSVAGPNGTSLGMRSIGVKTTGNDGNPIIPTAMADGIVAFKAQYGVASSASSPAISTWEGTDSSDWSSTWAPDQLTSANAGRIRAVRLLVVARSGTRETGEVTSACTTANYTNGPCPSGGTTQSDTTMPTINLADLPWAANNEWKHYRYKIYTTVVPIRNILWNGSWNYSGGTYSGQ